MDWVRFSKTLARIFFCASGVATITFSAQAQAQVRFTVIQTADLHSHFTNRESPLRRGGLARVLYKINQIREENANTLLLDAGDWSEGNMFFTLDTGETSQRLLSTMNYDAIVLGNHDWLVGPQALYDAFRGAGFETPVLSANLNFDGLDKNIRLQDYIHPYIVKEIGGIRVGIFGVSTFEFIYDSYFKPVKIEEPYAIAQKTVETLRHKENCQVVIMLSHLGITQDKLVGKLVHGIDYIVGGHTHILLTEPAYGGKTPITHVGFWGEYVGQTDLVYDGSSTKIEKYQVHPIDEIVPEDPVMKNLVDGAVVRMEQKYGPVYHDNVLVSEVDLPAQRTTGESLLGNWAVDSLRKVTGSVIAVDTPFFASRDLFKGDSSTADFFNAFPHIYNPYTQKAWTVQTFQLRGIVLKFLVSLVERLGFSLNLSNGSIVMDTSNGKRSVHSFKIDGAPISDFKEYEITSTDGIWRAIQFLQGHGVELDAKNHKDTGVEAWRAILENVRRHSPVTRENVSWEGRIRTLQPDLDMRPEDLESVALNDRELELTMLVRNAGLSPSAPTQLSVWSPSETGSLWGVQIAAVSGAVPALKPGETSRVTMTLDVSGRRHGRLPVHFHINPVPNEGRTANNDLEWGVDF